MADALSITPSLSMLDFVVKHAEAAFKYPKAVEPLGEKMRRVRERHGLRLKDVADAIGISQSALSQIESGETKNPKPQHFVKWCEFFGENQNSMLFGDPDPTELKRIRGLGAILGNRPRSRSQD